MKDRTDRFANVFRGKLDRTAKGAVDSRDFTVVKGAEFTAGVNQVRNVQVYYKGKEAGKLQYKHNPHFGKTILEVHDGQEAYLGTHAWRMLMETCEDLNPEYVVLNGRTGRPNERRRFGR